MLGFLYLVWSGQKAVSQCAWGSNWHRDCSPNTGSAPGWFLLISPTYSDRQFPCQTQDWSQPLCISWDLRQTLWCMCLLPTQHCPHRPMPPPLWTQLFPLSCTEWQQWGAQITLLESKIEDEGRSKTGKNPIFSQFSQVPVTVWKNYEEEQLAELK